jgi:isoleucyl-tRNA synthetase
VKEADPAIVEALEAKGKLLRAEAYLHAYPHCWRCDTPLLYYAKASWYVKTTEVKDRLLAANEEIGWHPDHIKHGRFGKWLEGNVDWALSRDRYWGTPLPIWECDQADCEERFCAGSVADLREKGAEIPDDLHRPYIDEVTYACERKGCEGTMRRVLSVIDTWFDSGSMPWAQYHYPFENEELFDRRFPADFICEAIDQTRGWFYTLLAESVLLFDTSSYRNVVCLGLILDPEGQKMSKSRGNVVEPWDVIDRHGADAFRWYYFASQQPWAGYRFSVETVGEAVRHFLLTLWNTYSFWVLYANAEGFGPDQLAEVWESGERGDGSAGELDRWALSRLQRTTAAVREHMDGFDCTTAAGAIADFSDELSNWYVRLSRRRFWDGDPAAFATLRHCLTTLVTLLAPFTPFLAEEIYTNLAVGSDEDFGERPDSVHLCDYPEVDAALIDEQLEAGMDAVRRTVELGRAARAQAKVKLRQPLRKAVVVASDAERAAIERLAEVVASELNVKELDFVHSEAELVSYRVRPNYRSLGPRFGKNMPQAAAAIEALDASGVADQLESGAQVGIAIDGKEHTLSADDINLVMEPLEGYQVEAEAGHAVALELELDDELRREGLAREVVRAVQEARKQAGLEVSDRISLELAGDDELLAAAREHEDYIAGETLANSVGYGADGAGESATIEGRELRIAVSKA